MRFDTSATKWQEREASRHHDAVRSLVCRHPDRFLFRADLVAGHAHACEIAGAVGEFLGRVVPG